MQYVTTGHVEMNVPFAATRRAVDSSELRFVHYNAVMPTSEVRNNNVSGLLRYSLYFLPRCFEHKMRNGFGYKSALC
jgi:hypothetical protein